MKTCPRHGLITERSPDPSPRLSNVIYRVPKVI
jgi:hypothetical protein